MENKTIWVNIILILYVFHGIRSQSTASYLTTFQPISPIDHPIRFSGTFGELRNNHFHMGLDLKSSNGKSGDPIKAVSNGYISRIKVEAGGYGQAIYIQHPEGVTTVYGHLNSFADSITTIVRDSQYHYQSFAVDLHFSIQDSIPQLSVQKSDIIAYMGTKGFSFGPHLHFEIRDTRTETALNPLLFNFEYIDNIPPTPHKLVVHFLDEQCDIVKQKIYSVKKLRNGEYALYTPIIHSPTPFVTYALFTRDQMDNTPNNNGIYKLEAKENGISVYETRMDSITFHHTRMINAHIDYKTYTSHKIRYHRLHHLPYCTIKESMIYDSLYIYDGPRHRFTQLSDSTQYIEILISDFNQNISTLSFQIKKSLTKVNKNQEIYQYFLPFDEKSEIHMYPYSMQLEEYTLYEDLKLRLSLSKQKDSDCLSQSIFIHESTTPIYKPIKLEIDLSRFLIPIGTHPFLAKCSGRSVFNVGHEISGNHLSAQIRSMGTYCLMTDTKAPTIKPITEFKKPYHNAIFRYRFNDNVHKTNQLTFSIQVDGKFAYHEISAKNNEIIIPLKELPALKKNRILIIEIRDLMGNTKTYSHTFFL